MVYRITDPTAPTATDQYRTDDGADDANASLFADDPPMVRGGLDHSDERDSTVSSDAVTDRSGFAFVPDESSE